MLPTPSTSHVNFDNVYEPAEDSFLLIDTLSSASETAFLSQRFVHGPTPVILEVGTGSGVVLAFVTAWIKDIVTHRNALTLGVDVNRYACKASAQTVQQAVQDQRNDFPREAQRSGVFVDMIVSDLTSCLRSNIVDVLIFNPPYVPTEELPGIWQDTESTRSTSIFERDSHLLALTYAGGNDGMETTDRLLSELPNVLSPKRGIAYVLLCAQNKPEEVKARIRAWPGSWNAETVGDSGKQGGWEKLQIVRIWQSE